MRGQDPIIQGHSAPSPATSPCSRCPHAPLGREAPTLGPKSLFCFLRWRLVGGGASRTYVAGSGGAAMHAVCREVAPLHHP